MRRIVLTLAFVASAGTVGAQTMQAPGTTGSEIRMNTQMNSGATAGGAGSSSVAPDVAHAPILEGAAETARKRIEMDGYRDVRGLAKGADGLWQGTAMRGNTSVQVTVDRAGNVAAK